ncbi:MAG TPA: T9SS type A sorting domain-containing protein, partial [Candidatus Marinimicrobia bacterium]|nr:T9SS type A sorting domain-containing protein [Candidatus Neomarinimicrobiota bacterium]
MSVKELINLSSSIVLEQNYPNPFNPQTTLSYVLPEEATVSLVVYDMLGKQVQTVVSRTQN